MNKEDYTLGDLLDVKYSDVKMSNDSIKIYHEITSRDYFNRPIEPYDQLVIEQGNNKIILSRLVIDRLPELVKRWHIV